ncbi:hypothetical protein EVAR_9954_1 [Eumeta japonica]|uniref:Uncharacterized protein n=1 Tax=Eumeta variegata TaxID=151549 RepID=A0A4C1TQV2_EUMVA|nr:hypothetical protein EVAR_9954_1 [Eumeta japonica]
MVTIVFEASGTTTDFIARSTVEQFFRALSIVYGIDSKSSARVGAGRRVHTSLLEGHADVSAFYGVVCADAGADRVYASGSLRLGAGYFSLAGTARRHIFRTDLFCVHK